MSQNKELKLNVAELQDAFVRLSQQNMELASELETESRRVTFLRAQVATPKEATPIPVLGVDENLSVPPSHMTHDTATMGHDAPSSGLATPTLQDTPTSSLEEGEGSSADEDAFGELMEDVAEESVSLLMEEKQRQINVS